MRHYNVIDQLQKAMNYYEWQAQDEERLEHYKTLKELKREADKASHIPNALEVETFNRAECGFINDYFFGDTESYNEWRRENDKWC